MKRILLLLPLCLLVVGCPEPPRTVGLKPGQIAPPLEGKGLDGNSIRLSDYRGKVVVVDFWGPWCGPCVKAIPHELEMAERFKGQPFTFLSVANCHSREELVEFFQKTTLPWPNIFEILSGPLAQEWHVDGFPTFIVIDGEGVIRHRSNGGPGVESTIEKLLDDLARKAK
jgi:thiol-disulfide isomerase/thioredoxin